MKERDDRIDHIKAVLVSFVVAIHVLAAHDTAGTATPFMHAIRIVLYLVSIPLFFAVSGWLSRPQPIYQYYRKKFVRVLVPFYIFSALKLLYSTVVSARYAHAETLAGRLLDAFIFGRLYWFAYAIFVVLAIAPLLWRLRTRMLFVALAASVGLSCVEEYLPSVFQLKAVAALLPYFILGMLVRRIWPRFAFVPLRKTVSNMPSRALAFTGRNAWAIMFLDAFFKAFLMQVMPQRAMAPLVICLDLLLCAATCRFLSHLSGHRFLGVSK